MHSRGDKHSPSAPVTDEPKSFAPKDPGQKTAWDQLDELGSTSRGGQVSRDDLVKLARTVVELRRTRSHVFPPVIFGEPAWDMLLALFLRASSNEGETVSNLSMSSGTPATTALRWIDYLEREGYVSRRSCRTDRRLVFVDLTDKADDAIRAYLTLLIDKGILAVPRT
jgi:hypothetical protein